MTATTGNLEIIKHLTEHYGADCAAKTENCQTVQHCAAQGYNGIASMFLFSRLCGVSVTQTDN